MSVEAAHARQPQTVDLLVIGGGINGTAIARDAAGRGLSVVLCERDDLGGHTSSASTKLIHGGLRYLEHYDFKLVRHALMEREVLLRAAPHIIWPLRFVLPYEPQRRPKWLLRMGLFLYDHLGGRKMLPGTRSVRLDHGPLAGELKDHLRAGFEYSDCWVEDARLVVLNARDAVERGADVRTRTEVTALAPLPDDSGYVARMTGRDGVVTTLHCRGVVNAAGPWVDAVSKLVRPGQNSAQVRLVKGSHIVVPRHYEGDHNYIFQNNDGRIIFAIPYERDYTLIGTTDVPYQRGEGEVVASPEEVAYLCEAASEYFAKPVRTEDVVHTFSGVRPLYEDHSSDASEVTRDYVLDLQGSARAPVLTVYGGKITTSRRLAEHALARILPAFPQAGQAWTRDAALPGGDIPDADFERFRLQMTARHADLPPAYVARLCRRYGTRMDQVLAQGPGELIGDELSTAEIDYLIDREWARTVHDVLWRRTKAGLHCSNSNKARVAAHLDSRFPDQEKSRSREMTAVS